MKNFKILIGCEESQTECIAFRNLGFEAYSCDLLECSGGFPEYHIKDYILKVINYDNWDLLIAHPPCTYLSNVSSCLSFNNDIRIAAGFQALEFFKKLLYCDINHICIENPKMQGRFLKQLPPYDQVIQPYYFGDPFSKFTCLWLKNLPCLNFTSLFPIEIKSWHSVSCDPKIRSKSFTGIAAAMAKQWGDYLTYEH